MKNEHFYIRMDEESIITMLSNHSEPYYSQKEAEADISDFKEDFPDSMIEIVQVSIVVVKRAQ